MNLADQTGLAPKHFPFLLEDIEEEEMYCGTFSMGLAISGNIGPFGGGVSIFITTDAQGYVALQYSLSGGGTADDDADKFSGAITPFVMLTNAPSYELLEGPGMQTGASMVKAIIDYVACLDDTGKILYQGIYLGGGLSTPGVHVSGGETMTLFGGPFDWDLYYSVTQY